MEGWIPYTDSKGILWRKHKTDDSWIYEKVGPNRGSMGNIGRSVYTDFGGILWSKYWTEKNGWIHERL